MALEKYVLIRLNARNKNEKQQSDLTLRLSQPDKGVGLTKTLIVIKKAMKIIYFSNSIYLFLKIIFRKKNTEIQSDDVVTKSNQNLNMFENFFKKNSLSRMTVATKESVYSNSG